LFSLAVFYCISKEEHTVSQENGYMPKENDLKPNEKYNPQK